MKSAKPAGRSKKPQRKSVTPASSARRGPRTAKKTAARRPAPRKASPRRRPARPARGISAWWEQTRRALRDLAQQEPETLWFGVVMLAALVLRFIQPDWYLSRQFHPDERWIFGVVSQLSYPQEPTGLQYGTFPLYVLATLKEFVALIAGYFGHFDVNRFVIWAGRMLSAIFDLGTIVFVYLLGRKILPNAEGRKLGLLAAALLTFTVLNIQMAHFFVVDVPLGFLVAGTLYWSLALAQTGRRGDYIWVGIFLGLAAATKTSAAPLAVAAGLGHLFGALQAPGPERAQRWRDLGLAAGVALLTFFVAMPHAFLDWDKFWNNQNEQHRILVTGLADVPYNRQYLNTVPYLYYVKNMVCYILGPLLSIVALLAFVAYPVIGLVQAGWLAAHKAWQELRQRILAQSSWWIILGFALVYFAIIGNSFAKFNRYLLPLTPVFALLAAHLMLTLRSRVLASAGRKIVSMGISLVLLGTVFWALAFSSIYQREHPWIAASRWIQENLPARTVTTGGLRRPTAILNEEWGDDLPTHVEGVPRKSFRMNKFPVQEPDTPRKREIIISMLQRNDLIVMADTRAHAVYRRLPDRYPINAAYYELMFAEGLGFELAAEFKNYPSLFGFEFADDRADESFTLYDHPRVYLFRRIAPPLPGPELARRLDARVAKIKARSPDARAPTPAPTVGPKAAAALLPTVVNANIGKSQGRPRFVFGKENGVTSALAWIILLEIIGLLSLPLTLSLFPRLPDSGVALSKIIGTLVLAWTTWMLVSLGIFRHLQSTTLLVLVVLGGLSLFWAWRRKIEIKEFIANRGKLWLTAEIVFLVAFVGYMLTKLYNPDINNPFGQGYNGGGEPMGVSFFTAVYQSVHFPPFDPWLSGYSINYYYFGQVILGVLAKVIGVSPAWSYQISISLLFALTFTGVYGLGLGLTGKRRWGLAAAVGAAMLGNLHTFFYMLEPFNRGMHWNEILVSLGRVWSETWHHVGRFEFIWNPTRLIKGTINEMPWFSFLYGDLHAHIIAIPYSLPVIGWGLNLLIPANYKTQLLPEAPGRTGTEQGLTFFVTALTLGSLSAINTWNFPPYALLMLGVLVAKAWQDHKGRGLPWRALANAGFAWLRLVIGGLALMFFFHKNFNPQSTSLAWVNPAVRTGLGDFLVFFGLPVFVLVTFWSRQMTPLAVKWLGRLGWSPRSRKPWWEKLQLVARAFWVKHPVGVYATLTVATGLTLLVLFNQILLAFLAVLLLAAGYCLGWLPLTPQLRLTMLLAVLALAIVLGCEIVHVRDFMGVGGDMSRMNTVFKFYMIVWVYLALAAASLLSHVFSGRREEQRIWRRLFGGARVWQVPALGLGLLAVWAAANYFQNATSLPWLSWALAASLLLAPLAWALWPKQDDLRRLWVAALVATVVVVSLYPPISIYNRMRLCSEFKRPTLNGLAYLDHMLPREAKALAWINANVKHNHIVLEAPGKRGYNCFDTRIAIFTGQPTLIGWVGQEEQMRYNPELTGGRTRDADRIYRTLDPAQAQALIERYQIEYVFVGENERKAYPGPGLAKFAQFMKRVYDQEGIQIYRRQNR